MTPAGYGGWTWADPTSDVRGLQKPNPSVDRAASTWYNTTPWTIAVNTSTTRQVAFYFVDWGGQGFQTKVEVLDGANVVDTRTVSGTNYTNGEYLVYRVTGNLTFRFTALSYNAAVSGMFFDPGFTQPSVSIAATNPNASEPSTTGTFTVTRSNNSGNLTVNYGVAGTATNGTDYSTLSGSVVIANGQTSATVTVTPINDAVAEPTENVVLTLSTGTGYTVGAQNTATVNIADDEPIVAITASDASASEQGPDVGTFTVTRTGSTASALFFDPVMAAADNFESGNTSGGSGFSNNWTLAGTASITSAGAPKEGSYHLQMTSSSSSATRAVDLAGST